MLALPLIGQLLVATAATVSSGALGEPTQQVDVNEQARALVEGATVSFRAGDFTAALRDFERARELRASPKLHYNVAVCHHQLMLAATDDQSRSLHADLAIRAYNDYLEAAPDAEDRDEVAGMIADLGGTVTRPGLKDDPFARAGTGSDGATSDAGANSADVAPRQSGATAKPPPPPEAPVAATADARPSIPEPTQRRTVTQFLLMGGATPALAGNTSIEGEATILLGARLGRRLRPRLMLGGSVALFVGGNNTPAQLVFSGGYAAGFTEYTPIFGRRKRLTAGLGLELGFARQAVRTRTEAPPPLCSAQGGGRNSEELVAARNGLLVSGRASLGVLLGAARRHVLSLQIMPALGVYGPGSKGGPDSVCAEGETPSIAVGLTDPQMFFLWGGLGYAVSF